MKRNGVGRRGQGAATAARSPRASGALLRSEKREEAMADNEGKRTLDLLRYYLLGSKFEEK